MELPNTVAITLGVTNTVRSEVREVLVFDRSERCRCVSTAAAAPLAKLSLLQCLMICDELPRRETKRGSRTRGDTVVPAMMSELLQLPPLTFLHYNNPKTLQRTTRRTLVHNITRKSSILNIDDPGAAGPGSWACCAPACTACHLAWPALTADGALHTWGHG